MSDPPYRKDCVVWYLLNGPLQYKGVWWPCKVLSSEEDGMVIESFADSHSYDVKESQYSEKIRLFSCEERDECVAKGQNKFKKMKETLKSFHAAIEEAQDFYRETEDDPTFSINLEPSVSVNNSSSFTTPGKTPSHLGNSSVFTTGGWTTDTSPAMAAGSRSSRKKRQRDIPNDPLLEPHHSDRNARKKQKRSSVTTPKGSKLTSSVVGRLSYDDGSEPLTSVRNGRKSGGQRNSTQGSLSPDRESSPEITPTKTATRRRKSGSTGSTRTASSKGTDLNADKDTCIDEQTNDPRLSAKALTSVVDETRGAEAADTRPPIELADSMGRETSNPSPISPLPGTQMDTDSGLTESSVVPGYDTLLKEIREHSFDTDDETSQSESDDSSELPAVNFSVKEDIKFRDLKENDVVWAKYGTFPFWPCIVAKVKVMKRSKKTKSTVIGMKTKSNICVKFLGYNDLDQSVKISNHKNVAKFATKRAHEFKEAGSKCYYKKEFEQAVEDARELIRLRAGGSIKGTPDQQYKAITKWRPVTYKPDSAGSSPMVEASRSHTGRSEWVESATPTGPARSHDLDSDSEECHYSSSEGEEDNEGYQYNLATVMKIVKEIEAELMAIAKGEVYSKRHKVFVSGTGRERESLKREGAFGPLMKWKQGKRTDFVEHLRTVAMKPQYQPLQCRVTHEYVLGVLLPEAMLKVMMVVEGLSYEQAEDKLDRL